MIIKKGGRENLRKKKTTTRKEEKKKHQHFLEQYLVTSTFRSFSPTVPVSTERSFALVRDVVVTPENSNAKMARAFQNQGDVTSTATVQTAATRAMKCVVVCYVLRFFSFKEPCRVLAAISYGV